ncbi:NAD-dependent epimerase/dehydratase family protein [Pseudomonas fluorescens group sp. PF-69]
MKVILPGGAGLIGQNLVARLKEQGYKEIVVLDKHRANLRILKSVHPDLTIEYADLADAGTWEKHFQSSGIVVMLQAQIGGNNYEDFLRNNVQSTKRIIELIKTNPSLRLVHISSSVLESNADDFYTRSKREQEELVISSNIPCPILRPTLMYGWFDRKHLGWLARFMRKTPVYPIPGNGRYMRQPLYAGDFCNIIMSCIKKPELHGVFNISGHEKIDYIDIIREIKRVTHSTTRIIKIPYSAFYFLLWLWGLVDKNPPFTTQQLIALSTKDEFEVIDWPSIFGVTYTPFANAIYETFNHSTYSKIVLEF